MTLESVATVYRDAEASGRACYGDGTPLPLQPLAASVRGNHQAAHGPPGYGLPLSCATGIHALASSADHLHHSTPFKAVSAAALVQGSHEALSAHGPTRLRSARQLFGEAF